MFRDVVGREGRIAREVVSREKRRCFEGDDRECGPSQELARELTGSQRPTLKEYAKIVAVLQLRVTAGRLARPSERRASGCTALILASTLRVWHVCASEGAPQQVG